MGKMDSKEPRVLPDNWGDQNLWVLIVRETRGGIFRETRAMDVSGGCLVHVSTSSGGKLAENIIFITGCKIKEEKDGFGELVKRSIVSRG